MAKIVSLGSGLQDIFLVDRQGLTPTAIGDEAIFGNILVGSKVDINKLYYRAGGGGVNSAITFANCGHLAYFAGNLGEDSAGAMLLNALQSKKVDTTFTVVDKTKTTGTSIILLDSKSGERTILTCRGASDKFDNLDPNILKVIRPDWLYVTTLRGDFETLNKFFKTAKRLGIKIMFNPGNKELAEKSALLKLFRFVDILSTNKTEAMSLVPGVIIKELLYHLGKIVPLVIITDGSNGGGASLAASEESYEFGIYEDVKIKDATGAGDAFGSGFLAAYANGKSFRDSLIFASANSTAVVQKIGANLGSLDMHTKLHPIPINQI